MAQSKKRAKLTKLGAIAFVIPFCDLESLAALTIVCKSFKDTIIAHPDWKFKAVTLSKDLRGHIGPVNVLIKLSSFVFSGSSDGKIKIWNTITWSCERTVNVSLPPNNQQSGAAVVEKQPAGGKVPGARGKKPAVKTPQLVESEADSEQTVAVTSLAVLDKVLFIGQEDGQLIIRMITDGSNRPEVPKVRAHNGAVRAIAVHPKQGRIFTGGEDKKIAVFDSKNYNRIAEIDQHTEVVTVLEICANRLFSGGQDGKLCVTSSSTGTPKFERELQVSDADKSTQPMGCITALASHDNKLYSAAWDCYIRVWDAKKLTMLSAVFLWPVGVCWSMAVRIIKGQPNTLVIGVRDGEIELRAIDKQNTLTKLCSLKEDRWCSRLERHNDSITCVLPLPDGRIVTGSEDWSLKVWGHRFAPPIAPRQPRAGPNQGAGQLRRAPSGGRGRGAIPHPRGVAPGQGPRPNFPGGPMQLPQQQLQQQQQQQLQPGPGQGQQGAYPGYPNYPPGAQYPRGQYPPGGPRPMPPGYAGGPRGAPGRPPPGYQPGGPNPQQLSQQQLAVQQRRMYDRQQQQQQGAGAQQGSGQQGQAMPHGQGPPRGYGQQPRAAYPPAQAQQGGQPPRGAYPTQQYQQNYQGGPPRGYPRPQHPAPPNYPAQRP